MHHFQVYVLLDLLDSCHSAKPIAAQSGIGTAGSIGSEVESVDGTYCFDFSRAFAEAVESGNENNLPVVVIAALQGMCLVAGFYSFFFFFSHF